MLAIKQNSNMAIQSAIMTALLAAAASRPIEATSQPNNLP
jgi:hypothetical protein